MPNYKAYIKPFGVKRFNFKTGQSYTRFFSDYDSAYDFMRHLKITDSFDGYAYLFSIDTECTDDFYHCEVV